MKHSSPECKSHIVSAPLDGRRQGRVRGRRPSALGRFAGRPSASIRAVAKPRQDRENYLADRVEVMKALTGN
jgi:hypothetical protein